jgi:hypothetical protein
MNSLNSSIIPVKSVKFGSIWDTMFLMSLGFPSNPTSDQVQVYRTWYIITCKLIPCISCREYINNVLQVTCPLNFESSSSLFESIYCWKRLVNQKLDKPNDPLDKIKSKYLYYFAKSCQSGKGCE